MYTKIDDITWRQMKQKRISDTSKILYLYLFTCPHRNMIGLYYIPFEYCSADLCMSIETVSKGFHELEKAGLLAYDKAEEMVLLVDFLKTNPMDNANVEKKACSVFLDLPETQLFQCFADILNAMDKPYSLLLDTVSERLAKGYANTEYRRQNTEDRIQKAETESRIQKTEDSSAPCDAAADGEAEPFAISLPLNNGEEYGITQSQVDEFQELYPAVDVPQQLRNMRGWLNSNPKNRKTASGIGRFVNGWLAREQNRAPRKSVEDQSGCQSFSALAEEMETGGAWR